jgi:hypothetical protein
MHAVLAFQSNFLRTLRVYRSWTGTLSKKEGLLLLEAHGDAESG